MTRTITNATDWLKNHWFLFAALVAMGSAWGGAMAQVSSLNSDIDELKTKQQQVQELARSADKLQERTDIMLSEMQAQRHLLNQILMGQRSLMLQQQQILDRE
jgi:small-conductance mechanosensitive channel